jgi:hypothetical protein
VAIGDDALAAGMDVLDPSTDLVKDGAEEITKTRDYIAQRTNMVTPIANGGTGASNQTAARTNLDVPSNADLADGLSERVSNGSAGTNAIALRWEGGRIKMRVDATDVGDIANTGDTAANAATIGSVAGDLNNVYNGYMNGAIYSRTLGTRTSVYIQPDGTMGNSSSSERYKQDIEARDVPDEAVAALGVVEFAWRPDVVEGAPREVGMIAEAVEAAGLGWLVRNDDEGRPDGVNYEMLALALVPVVQRLLTRVAALESDSGGS